MSLYKIYVLQKYLVINMHTHKWYNSTTRAKCLHKLHPVHPIILYISHKI